MQISYSWFRVNKMYILVSYWNFIRLGYIVMFKTVLFGPPERMIMVSWDIIDIKIAQCFPQLKNCLRWSSWQWEPATLWFSLMIVRYVHPWSKQPMSYLLLHYWMTGNSEYVGYKYQCVFQFYMHTTFGYLFLDRSVNSRIILNVLSNETSL